MINIGRRDLVAADVLRLRGIFNSTSNFILGEMATGRSFADALAEAQRRGIAETDPTLDVEGWDTANKLVIIANSFLGVRVTLADVHVAGISQVTTEQLEAELAAGNTIKLLATAERTEAGYTLAVRPTVLGQDEFLGSCDGWEMGIELQSDLYGRMYHKIWEREQQTNRTRHAGVLLLRNRLFGGDGRRYPIARDRVRGTMKKMLLSLSAG